MLRFLGTIIFSFVVSVASLAATAPIAPKFVVPPLSAPVMDLADIIDANTEAKLDSAIRDLRDSGGSQITVLTVPTLNSVPIEQASINVVDQWKLGTKKGDNGILFLIAFQDRQMRIEVGQGLEGSLPDVIAKRIIADRVAPYMRQGRTSEAVVIGVASIVQYTDPNFDFASKLEVPSPNRNRANVDDVAVKVKLAFFVLMLILIFLRPRRRGIFFFPMGGGFGGGGGGFGGGGGGGWSGGGGGFSGGGASGGW